MYALASRLNKTVQEIEQITVNEFHGWIAYFKIEDAKCQNK